MKTITRRTFFAATGALLLCSAPAFAADTRIGALEIRNPHARATAPGAPVAGGYMTIVNHGTGADRLLAGMADFAGKVEIHEMKMDGDMMIMRPVDGGLEIPAGGTVELKPGGYHVMFMKLGEQLKPGEERRVVLRFEGVGAVEVVFTVEAMGAGMKMN